MKVAEVSRSGSVVPATTVVWAGASLAGLSLVAAAAAMMLDARNLPQPLLQVPAVVLTAVVGVVVVAAVFLAVDGRVSLARYVLAASVAVVALLPVVRYIPFVYHVMYERDLESLFPPLWPYSLAFPLLLVALGELYYPALPGGKGTRLGLVVAVIAAVLLLLFGSVLVGTMGSKDVPALFLGSLPAWIDLPMRPFWAYVVLEAIAAGLVLGGLLPRWGRRWEGAALLVLGGLVIELFSTAFFAGTPKRVEFGLYGWPFFPFVPVLAGTVPGILAVFAGMVVGWGKVVGDQTEQEWVVPGDLPMAGFSGHVSPEGQAAGGGVGGIP